MPDAADDLPAANAETPLRPIETALDSGDHGVEFEPLPHMKDRRVPHFQPTDVLAMRVLGQFAGDTLEGNLVLHHRQRHVERLEIVLETRTFRRRPTRFHHVGFVPQFGQNPALPGQIQHGARTQ